MQWMKRHMRKHDELYIDYEFVVFTDLYSMDVNHALLRLLTEAE